MVIATLKSKLNGKLSLHGFRFLVRYVDDVQLVCAQKVAILHMETFVTFDFDSSLISGPNTDHDLDRIKLIFGRKLMDNWAKELCK